MYEVLVNQLKIRVSYRYCVELQHGPLLGSTLKEMFLNLGVNGKHNSAEITVCTV